MCGDQAMTACMNNICGAYSLARLPACTVSFYPHEKMGLWMPWTNAVAGCAFYPDLAHLSCQKICEHTKKELAGKMLGKGVPSIQETFIRIWFRVESGEKRIAIFSGSVHFSIFLLRNSIVPRSGQWTWFNFQRSVNIFLRSMYVFTIPSNVLSFFTR